MEQTTETVGHQVCLILKASIWWLAPFQSYKATEEESQKVKGQQKAKG